MATLAGSVAALLIVVAGLILILGGVALAIKLVVLALIVALVGSVLSPMTIDAPAMTPSFEFLLGWLRTVGIVVFGAVALAVLVGVVGFFQRLGRVKKTLQGKQTSRKQREDAST